MFIGKAKYHKEIIAAYTRGFEQGFELAQKLKRDHELIKQEAPCQINSLAKTEPGESSLIFRQLVDIARKRGIDL